MDRFANRRFVRFAFISMVVFLAASLSFSWMRRTAGIPDAVLWAAGALSIIALLAPLWALWRYLWDVDEYLRSIQLKAIFLGLAVLLLIVTGWGYFELLTNSPRLPIYWLNPIYWAAYSIGVIYFSRSRGAEA